MLRSVIILAGFTAVSLSLAACGGTTVENTGGAGGSAGMGGAGGAGAGGSAGMAGAGGTGEPSGPGGVSVPEPGAMEPGDPMGGTVLAVHKLYLGDTDRMGNPSGTAWKLYGFDLDQKTSTKTSNDLCKPAGGGKASTIYEDGEDGRDNSFGKNVLPLITSIAADASTQINDSIDKGSFTIMLDIQQVGTKDSYNPLLTNLYAGSTFIDPMTMMEAVPKWDGTDAWPVVYELLEGGDITKPKVFFEKSYVVKDPMSGARTWVSAPPPSGATIKLNLAVAGYTLGLDITSAYISTELSADNKKGTNGTIAGIINTEQLISELAKIAGSFDKNLCPPSATFDSIATSIRQASDIMTDGAGNHQDPTKTCDGISIGLGFDADAVLLGDVAKPADPQPDPCAMP